MKFYKKLDEKTKKGLKWLLEGALNLGIIVILVLVIQTWIIAPFDVSGSSMCDTFNNINGECHMGFGEKIIINEALYLFQEPERGDVVVFNQKTSDLLKIYEEKNDWIELDIKNADKVDDKYYIKRIIGMPGEIVEIKDGKVYITKAGENSPILIDEPYLNSVNKGNTETHINDFSVFEVPEGHYFMMGDNRKSSTDSRTCFFTYALPACKENPKYAFVPRENIRGKASVVWWPFSSWRLVEDVNYPELEN
ncbi:signal peptidase I [Candidatus Peregrinibacteria bacterium]|nr:signal peptidase I [Candidatus Peregrinibacteria bacterium]